MRFVFNFIFFGLLFYLIWLYLPDAFQTLHSWAGQIILFLRELIQQVIAKVSTMNIPERPL